MEVCRNPMHQGLAPTWFRAIYLLSWPILARGSNETAIEKRSSRPQVSVKRCRHRVRDNFRKDSVVPPHRASCCVSLLGGRSWYLQQGGSPPTSFVGCEQQWFRCSFPFTAVWTGPRFRRPQLGFVKPIDTKWVTRHPGRELPFRQRASRTSVV